MAGKGAVDSDMEANNDCRNRCRRQFRLAVGWQMRQQIEALLRTKPRHDICRRDRGGAQRGSSDLSFCSIKVVEIL